MKILSKFHLSSSSGLGLTVLWIYFHKPLLSHLVDHNAVYETAPATPGLLISVNLLTINVQAEDMEAKRYKMRLTYDKCHYFKKILQFIQFSCQEKLDLSLLSYVSLTLYLLISPSSAYTFIIRRLTLIVIYPGRVSKTHGLTDACPRKIF